MKPPGHTDPRAKQFERQRYLIFLQKMFWSNLPRFAQKNWTSFFEGMSIIEIASFGEQNDLYELNWLAQQLSGLLPSKSKIFCCNTEWSVQFENIFITFWSYLICLKC